MIEPTSNADDSAVAQESAAPKGGPPADTRLRAAMRALSVLSGLAAIGFLIAALVVVPWEIGSKAEWVSGIGTFAAVVVALWQTINIQMQAKKQVLDSQRQFEDELKAAEARSATELENARALHKSELEAQRELARVDRLHLREQEFKLALIRVSKAISAYCHDLATLVEQGNRAAKLEDKTAREDALLSVSKELGLRVHDVSLEIAGAHMFTQNDDLHEALNLVNRAMLLGPKAEISFRQSVMRGGIPNPAPIFIAQTAVQEAIGDTRQMAGDLLHTGWE